MFKGNLALCVAASVVLGVSVADAASAHAKKKHSVTPTTQQAKMTGRSVKGELATLNVETKTLTLKVAKKREITEVTVVTDSGTEFVLDGASVTIADLRPGMKLAVQPETGTATRIIARSLTAKEQKQYDESHPLEKPEKKTSNEGSTTRSVA